MKFYASIKINNIINNKLKYDVDVLRFTLLKQADKLKHLIR